MTRVPSNSDCSQCSLENLKGGSQGEIRMEAIRPARAYERHAWLILVLIWTIHLVLSARDFLPTLQDACLGCLPGGLTPIQASTGMTWTQLLASDPKLATYLASVLVDDEISGVGLAVFGMIVSFTSYRKGAKWAWYLSWSNPIGILTAQLNMYALTKSTFVIVLAVVFISACLLGLFLPYRQFFPRKAPAS